MPKTLLLADDSVTIQKVVGITFANEDVDLVTVDNGDSALESALARKPDLVLADIGMPGLDGYALCAAIRAEPTLAAVPVLLMTGTFETYDEARANEVGASGHIAKPFEAQALVDQVYAILEAGPAEEPEPAPMLGLPEPEAASPSLAEKPAFDSDRTVFHGAVDPLSETPARPMASDADLPELPNTDFSAEPAGFASPPAEQSAGSDPLVPEIPDVPAPPAAPASGPGFAFEDLEFDEPTPQPSSHTAIFGEAEGETSGTFGDEVSQPDFSVAAPDLSAHPAPFEDDASPSTQPLGAGHREEAEDTDESPNARTAFLDPMADLGPPPAEDDALAATRIADPILDGLIAPPPTARLEADPVLDTPLDPLPELPAPEAPAFASPSVADLDDAYSGGDDSADDDVLLEAEAMDDEEPYAAEPTPEPVFDAEPLPALPEPETAALPAPEPIHAEPGRSDDEITTPDPEPEFPLPDVAPSEPTAPELADTAPSSAPIEMPALDAGAIRQALEKVAWDAFGNVSEQLVREVVARVEAIAWEVIPQIAEQLIRDELARISEDDDNS